MSPAGFIVGAAMWAGVFYLVIFKWRPDKRRHAAPPEPIPGAICPICKNETVVPIKASSKAASVAAFGVLSIGSISKTLRCLHCNARF